MNEHKKKYNERSWFSFHLIKEKRERAGKKNEKRKIEDEKEKWIVLKMNKLIQEINKKILSYIESE